MWGLIVSVPDHCLSFYFGCVKMAHLYVPSRDRSRKIMETSASEALPFTIVLRSR